jgi:hypothetical protein
LLSRDRSPLRPYLSRRQFLRHSYTGLAGLLLAGTGTYALDTRAEPGQLRITRVEIPIAGLPDSFDGYRIVHLTDVHFGPATAYQTVHRAFQIAGQLAPDLIALTGDYVTRWLDERNLVPALRQLQAPDGVWAVMGNHDHWTDVAGVRRILDRAGVVELRNASVALTRSEDVIFLAGVDDVWERQHDLQAALRDVPESGHVILLAHEPDYADEVSQTGRVALQLSGHSHGGQINLPLLGTPLLSNLVHLARKYPYGLYRLQDMWLYTSAGVGRGLLPRVWASPELVEIVLRPATA